MKIFLRFLSIGILVIGIYLGFGPPQRMDFGFAKNFPDISSGSSLEQHIQYLTDKGILSGYPDGTFKPEQTINRAEALKIIFKLFDGKPMMLADPKSHVSVSFPDVKANQWFAPYVATAKMTGVIAGYPDGTFRPNQTVNRAEFVKMTIKALPFAQSLIFDTSAAIQQFSDIDNKGWYVPYLSAALSLKFLPRSQQFKPTTGMQRQDAAEIIYQISQYLDQHPQAGSKSSAIPYVPEEAFTVVDPTIEHSYHPEEVGPDKLTVQKDINNTEINNTYGGYHISLDEVVDVKNLENSPDQLTITYPQGCVVDIRTEDNSKEKLTPESYYQKMMDPKYFMAAPDAHSLKKLSINNKLQGYVITASWKYNQSTQDDYFVFTPAKIYTLNGFGFGGQSDRECNALSESIISHFEIQ